MSTSIKIVNNIPTDKIPKTFYVVPTINGRFELNLTDDVGNLRPLDIPSTETFLSILKGIGSPEGKVEAKYGSLYYDTNKTNGVVSYLKTSDSANTGWVAYNGDTGWKKRSDSTAYKGSAIFFRRINNTVFVAFGGGQWDNYQFAPPDPKRPNMYNHIFDKGTAKRIRLRTGDSGSFTSNFIPEGFRPAKNVITTVYNDNGLSAGSVYIGSPSDEGVVYFTFEDGRIPNSGSMADMLKIGQVSYLTNDSWPQYDLTPYKI